MIYAIIGKIEDTVFLVQTLEQCFDLNVRQRCGVLVLPPGDEPACEMPNADAVCLTAEQFERIATAAPTTGVCAVLVNTDDPDVRRENDELRDWISKNRTSGPRNAAQLATVTKPDGWDEPQNFNLAKTVYEAWQTTEYIHNMVATTPRPETDRSVDVETLDLLTDERARDELEKTWGAAGRPGERNLPIPVRHVRIDVPDFEPSGPIIAYDLHLTDTHLSQDALELLDHERYVPCSVFSSEAVHVEVGEIETRVDLSECQSPIHVRDTPGTRSLIDVLRYAATRGCQTVVLHDPDLYTNVGRLRVDDLPEYPREWRD